MKRFHAPKLAKLLLFVRTQMQNILKAFVRHWDVIALIYFTICLLDYHFYFNEIHNAKSQTNPWPWPIHNLPSNRQSKRLDEVHNERTDLKLSQSQEKLLAMESVSNTKIILFDHPAFNEEIYYAVNQSICGKCEITYDRMLYDKADAVVFHFAGTTKVSKRRYAKLYGSHLIYCIWQN